MQSLQITVLQILWGICSEQRAQVKYKPSGLFGNVCVSVTIALMNHVNHSQLLNNGGGKEGKAEGTLYPLYRELCSYKKICVSVATCQLGGHKFPIQILLFQRLLLLPRDSAEICKAQIQHAFRGIYRRLI